MESGMARTMRLADASDGKALPKRLNFSAEALARLACPPGRDRLYVYDAKVRGLAYVITATGARAFYLVRKIGGRKERIRLGGAEITVELARKLADKHNGEIAKGADPSELKRSIRNSETLQETFDRWKAKQEENGARSKTLANEASRFTTCLDGLASRKILAIGLSEITALHQRIGRENGHVSANRAIQLLRRLFNFAGVIPNPIRKINKVSTVDFFPEESRDRFLSDAEVGRLFAALAKPEINATIADFLRLCLFTGQRKSNVMAMNAADIDLENQRWTIPQRQAKAKKSIAVHLSAPVMEIIKNRIGHDSGYIFPGPGKSGHLAEPKSTWSHVRRLAKLPDVTIHDLRRTMASFQAKSGTSSLIIGKSLGHSSPISTAIYARMDISAVRPSVEAAAAAMVAAGDKK